MAIATDNSITSFVVTQRYERVVLPVEDFSDGGIGEWSFFCPARDIISGTDTQQTHELAGEEFLTVRHPMLSDVIWEPHQPIVFTLTYHDGKTIQWEGELVGSGGNGIRARRITL